MGEMRRANEREREERRTQDRFFGFNHLGREAAEVSPLANKSRAKALSLTGSNQIVFPF
jgi:hypothetical protein